MSNQKILAAISFAVTACVVGYKLYTLYLKEAPSEPSHVNLIEEKQRRIPNHVMFESFALKNALTYYVRSCEGGHNTELLGVAALEKPDKSLVLNAIVTDFLKKPNQNLTQDIAQFHATVEEKSVAQFMQIVRDKDVYTINPPQLEALYDEFVPYSSKKDIEESLHIKLGSYFCPPIERFGTRDRFNKSFDFFENSLKGTNLYLNYDFDVLMDSNNKPTIYRLKYPEQDRYQRLFSALSYSMPLVTDIYFQNSVEGKPADQRFKYIYKLNNSTIVLTMEHVNKEFTVTVHLL